MALKVFISHQRADSILAANIAGRLRGVHNIECYLDLIDPEASSAGDALGDHVRAKLGECTQLLAVVSEATRSSWWVPWEIGIATEKDYPLASYAGGHTMVPEYLRKWPYLRSDHDLDRYAAASKEAANDLAGRRVWQDERTARSRATKNFYADMRARLGR